MRAFIYTNMFIITRRNLRQTLIKAFSKFITTIKSPATCVIISLVLLLHAIDALTGINNMNTCPDRITITCPLGEATQIPMCLKNHKFSKKCEPCTSESYQTHCKSPINDTKDTICNLNDESKKKIASDACATFFGSYLEYNYNFAWICEIHDYCYAWTNDKKNCDIGFKNNMIAQCGTTGYPASCGNAEEIAYFFVNLAGLIKKFHRNKRKRCLKRKLTFEDMLKDKQFILGRLKNGDGSIWIPQLVSAPENKAEVFINEALRNKTIAVYEKEVFRVVNLINVGYF